MSTRTRRASGLAVFRAILFWVAAAFTALTSVVIYAIASVNDGGFPNWLALITITGTVVAYWLAWVFSNHRLVRFVALIVFVAALVPAVMSPVIVAYGPGLLGILAGTPYGAMRTVQDKPD